MGVRVIVGKDEGGEGQDVAVFYDSTTGWAFGPVFGGIPKHPGLEEGKDEAEAFFAHLEEVYERRWRAWPDHQLETAYGQWVAMQDPIEGATGQGRR